MIKNLTLGLIILVSCHLAVSSSAEQGRRLNRIKVVDREAPVDVVELPADLVPPLPEPAACEATVREAAAAYGSARLASLLDDEFPNRAELLDALQRANQRVSNLELQVESIENARVLDWQVAAMEESDAGTSYTLISDCIADVRVRAVFDGSTSGERAVLEPARGEWRIRFTALVQTSGLGR